MNDAMSSPVRVDVADGFVDETGRSRAQAMVTAVCRRSPRARGRVVLTAHTRSGSTTATADAILVLDEYRLLCAGAVAPRMPEAIAQLETRLLRQVAELGAREPARSPMRTDAHRRLIEQL
jgi:hypothetical protein